MNNNIKKFLLGALMVCLSFTSFATEISAATGYQGYAIYRDGVLLNYTWHAGMMDESSANDYKPIVHHSGSGVVKFDELSGFKNGHTFMGIYRPWSAPSSYYRDLFVAKGRKLVSEQIPYNLAYQLYYDTSAAGTYVDAAEITSIRCDGVVEYIHEWYNFRIYGNDTYWDITDNSFWGRNHHSGTAVTPESQTWYMTKITSREPW